MKFDRNVFVYKNIKTRNYSEIIMANLITVAIQYLAERSCSEDELMDYLIASHGHHTDAEQHISDAMSYLLKHNMLNDQRLAEQIAVRYANKGNRFIHKMLKQRKISEPAIAHGLSIIPDEKKRALVELRYKMDGLVVNDKREAKQTLIRFLKGRQFCLNVIKQVIEDSMRSMTQLKPAYAREKIK